MSFHSTIQYFLVPFFLIILLVPIFFIPVLMSDTTLLENSSSETSRHFSTPLSYAQFQWPIPGYTRISSYFGKRNSPTGGASSYHQGIDIPAPTGTYLVAPIHAQVVTTGFQGSGGYTIILKNNELEFIFHHVSPHYIVKVGEYVVAGQTIGQVRS